MEKKKGGVMKYILIIYAIYASFQWFSNNMAVKGLLYHFSQKYGSEVLDNLDMKKIIQTAIENSLNDLKH